MRISPFRLLPFLLLLTFAWPARGMVVQDTTPPRVVEVSLEAGLLQVDLTEEPDLQAATSEVLLDGHAVTWTLSTDRYALIGTSPVPAGSHTLHIGTGPLDLAGLGLQAPFDRPFQAVTNVAKQPIYTAPDPYVTKESAAGNVYGFQGLPRDPETGLIYYRNRYYDPDLGRFISADPKGYLDGPSQYALEGGNPINGSDPLGLANLTSARAATPDLDTERMIRDLKVAKRVLTNPRVQGGLKVAGATCEMTAGVAAGCTPTGVGQVVGGIALAHGADGFVTGVKQVFSGKTEQTLTSQGIEHVVRSAGVSPKIAHNIAEGTDVGLSAGLTMGAGALGGSATATGVGTGFKTGSWKASSSVTETVEASAASVTDKLQGYLLNPDHPIGGPKARWFEKALGFTRENAADLAKQIVFDEASATQTAVTQYGTKFNQTIQIVGANGRVIPVKSAWIRGADNVPKLVTIVPGD